MRNYQVGDIVARKSYGGDVLFSIAAIDESRNDEQQCIVKGVMYRLEADAPINDLVLLDTRDVRMKMDSEMRSLKTRALLRNVLENPISITRNRRIPGKILHVDGCRQFLNSSMMYYRSIGLRPVGVFIDEPEQPSRIRGLLQQHNPDILVITGHDGIRRGTEDISSLSSYTKSSYFVQSVRAARAHEKSLDKLCIFAGACQSHYEAIMGAGANFASSPARVLIHSLDPVKVAQRVATTDNRRMVTPAQAVRGTVSGSRGIGGVETRGRLTWR